MAQNEWFWIPSWGVYGQFWYFTLWNISFQHSKVQYRFNKCDLYPFLCTLIGAFNLWYPRLLVDFEAKVKMTGSVHTKNRKKVYIEFFLK